MKNKAEFRYQFIITILDKLLIGIILIIASFLFNTYLKRQEFREAKNLEKLKLELNLERDKYQNTFLILVDSLDKAYKKNQEQIERRHIESREDLLRKEDQLHRGRISQLENQYRIHLELLKNNNSFNFHLLRTSLEKTANTWTILYKISTGSKLIQEALINFEDFIHFNLDVPLEEFKENYIQQTKREKRKVLETRILQVRQEISEIERILDPGLSEGYEVFDLLGIPPTDADAINTAIKELESELPSKKEELKYLFTLLDDNKELSSASLISEEKIDTMKSKIKTNYIDKFYLNLNTDIDDLFQEISEAEQKIEENYFWLNETQRVKMKEYLKSYLAYLNEYPFARSFEERDILNKKLEKSRLDIFDLRNSLLKDLKETSGNNGYPD